MHRWRRQTDTHTQTDRQTNRRTWQLYDWISLLGPMQWKEEQLLCQISMYKLTTSGVTNITWLHWRARWTTLSGGHAAFMLGLSYLAIIWNLIFVLWDHWLWVCVSEAVCLWCFFPMEPESFSILTVDDGVSDRGQVTHNQWHVSPYMWHNFFLSFFSSIFCTFLSVLV